MGDSYKDLIPEEYRFFGQTKKDTRKVTRNGFV